MKKRLFKIIIGLGAPFLAALLFFMAYIHTPVTPKDADRDTAEDCMT